MNASLQLTFLIKGEDVIHVDDFVMDYGYSSIHTEVHKRVVFPHIHIHVTNQITCEISI